MHKFALIIVATLCYSSDSSVGFAQINELRVSQLERKIEQVQANLERHDESNNRKFEKVDNLQLNMATTLASLKTTTESNAEWIRWGLVTAITQLIVLIFALLSLIRSLISLRSNGLSHSKRESYEAGN